MIQLARLTRPATLKRRFTLPLIALSLLLAACGRVGHDPEATAGSALREVEPVHDTNPDPHTLEFDLIAQASQYEFISGHPTTVWTYNGQLPGPLIEANVGDEIIVHFINRLPEATTVHWHGIRLTPGMDGSHLSQAPTPPGESFEYRFTVSDAGLYWYHPHHNGSTQVAQGLYGPLLVHGPSEPQFTRERVLVLSDALLDDRRELVSPETVMLNPLVHSLGVEGNTPLVNGQIRPVIKVAPGGRERWHIVNAATSRYFRIAIPGRTFHLIGADGGLADHPYELADMLLAVGERADIVVTAPSQPGSAELSSLPYNKILAELNFSPRPAEILAQISYSGNLVPTPPIPATLANYPDPPAIAAERFRQFAVKMTPELNEYLGSRMPSEMDGHGEQSAQAEFVINGDSFPDVPIITAKLGSWERWTLNNHSFSDHPFHLHGFRFLLESIDGVAPPFRVWKDTINMPITDGNNRINILVDFDGHPGKWVYHCHILHHQEHGMMAEVDVE